MSTDPDFAAQVHAIVARIPPGKVTTYGRIARAVGDPRASRQVGWVLSEVEDENLPCHRVVNRDGVLTGGWAFGHPEIMRGRLREEGVPFLDEEQVDIARCVWDPSEPGHQLGLSLDTPPD